MASDAQLTPMMAQYRRIKSELPKDARLLFRLGDFYELFFEDAQVGAQLLNVALTKRGVIPMCGIPLSRRQQLHRAFAQGRAQGGHLRSDGGRALTGQSMVLTYFCVLVCSAMRAQNSDERNMTIPRPDPFAVM